jgi:hypothetical protein
MNTPCPAGKCPLAPGECAHECYLAACGKPDGKPDEMDLAKWDLLVGAARSVA